MSENRPVLPRTVTVQDGDWTSLREALLDLRTAVERLVALEEEEGGTDAGGSEAAAGDQNSVAVDLDGGSAYEFFLAAEATANANLELSAGGSATTLLAMSSGQPVVANGFLAPTPDGGHAWCGTGTGDGGSTTTGFSGSTTTPLGSSLVMSGGFTSATTLWVRKI